MALMGGRRAFSDILGFLFVCSLEKALPLNKTKKDLSCGLSSV